MSALEAPRLGTVGTAREPATSTATFVVHMK